MSRYRTDRLLILGLVALVLELTVMERLTFHGGRPELLLLLACFAALFATRPRQAYWAAWILGLAKDLGSSSPLGFHALIFVGVAWILILLRKVVFREHPMVQFVIAFAATAAMNLLVATFVCLFRGGVPLGTILLGTMTGGALTAAIAPVVMWKLRHWRYWMRPHGS